MPPDIGALESWSDSTVLQLKRQPMHVPLSGFVRRPLDGRWRLELFDHPDEVSTSAITGRRRKGFEVDVPGNWPVQLPDLDPPHYTNIQMPFPGPPPRLPDRNPTGVYRRSFEVPASWLKGGKRVVLHLGGAESVHLVCLNGTFAGYGTDSRLPSEYDITDLVIAGDNDLAVVVLRYSANSYIEDQDQWWMAGLHRSVWIESRPRVHLADVPIDLDYEPKSGQGTIVASARVDFGALPQAGWTVRTTVHQPSGRPVRGRAGTDTQVVPDEDAHPYEFTGFVTESRFEIDRAKPWSAEEPNRYRVLTELISPTGRVVQSESQLIGLRRVEVRNGQLRVNGRTIRIHGVNRHDHHPDRGKAVTVDDMRDDLIAMRAHNINAVRTSHYPNSHEFYDLCDELGFYVVDEANVESHGYNWSLCDDDRYRAAWLERGARMVKRDRNHPCIIAWSLGNESGYGANHDALAGWIRRADPSRPLHYEDAIRIKGWADGGREATDIVCPMYPEIADLEAYGQAFDRGEVDRPLIMCEYSHAMGNSNGSLADYWDVIDANPGLQGGFLWEWKDQGIRQAIPGGPAGATRLAYGGQFGDEPNDGNFVADGLMSADLEPHPAMREVAWVHRPVVVTKARGGLKVENRRSFVDLGDLEARWELLDDTGSLAEGRLRVPRLGPGQSVVVPWPGAVGRSLGRSQRGRGRWLTVRWMTKADTWFAPAGHLVAWDQVVVPKSATGKRAAVKTLPSSSSQSTARALEHLVAPELALWRAAVDNDGFKLMPELSKRIGVGGQALRRWQELGIDTRPAEELVEHQFDVSNDDRGSLFRHRVTVIEDDLPRIGVSFTLPPRFRRTRWFGRGPHENYPDRNRSAMLGTWEGELDLPPYLVPQEFGLRTDCRWLELIDPDDGEMIRIEAVEPEVFHYSAVGYSADELFAATTETDLAPSRQTVVHLDLAHRGLGTASCGPDVLPRYRLAAGTYEFSYRAVGLADDHSH